jgi:hypothetical protein
MRLPSVFIMPDRPQPDMSFSHQWFIFLKPPKPEKSNRHLFYKKGNAKKLKLFKVAAFLCVTFFS